MGWVFSSMHGYLPHYNNVRFSVFLLLIHFFTKKLFLAWNVREIESWVNLRALKLNSQSSVSMAHMVELPASLARVAMVRLVSWRRCRKTYLENKRARTGTVRLETGTGEKRRLHGCRSTSVYGKWNIWLERNRFRPYDIDARTRKCIKRIWSNVIYGVKN